MEVKGYLGKFGQSGFSQKLLSYVMEQLLKYNSIFLFRIFFNRVAGLVNAYQEHPAGSMDENKLPLPACDSTLIKPRRSQRSLQKGSWRVRTVMSRLQKKSVEWL